MSSDIGFRDRHLPRKQTFFPGHEDGAEKHYPNDDGTNRCGACGIDLTGRVDMKINPREDAEREAAAQARKEAMKEHEKARAMARDWLMRQMLREGVGARAPDPESVKLEHEKQMLHEAQTRARLSEMEKMAAGMESAKPSPATEQEKIRAELLRLSQVGKNMSPQDRALAMQKARANAIESLIVALFYTDPRIHAALLADPKNDDPAENERELTRMWEQDIGSFRSESEARAHKMVEIMDARGKAAST